MSKIIVGDNLTVLRTFPDACFDCCVTDPPYGLRFMGKKWDYAVPSVELWTEVLRVLKPGAHLLSFGGTRTYHRLVVNIEDAGFEIRDQLQWLYGSGFPKSLDVSKAIDKAAGAERERIEGPLSGGMLHVNSHNARHGYRPNDYAENGNSLISCDPRTPAAREWSGWGTALKPACEPICLARKPVDGTVAENVLRHGCGALNIDGCRIEAGEDYTDGGQRFTRGAMATMGNHQRRPWVEERIASGEAIKDTKAHDLGRWPANVIMDEEAAQFLDQMSGTLTSGLMKAGQRRSRGGGYHGNFPLCATEKDTPGDSGGASRFFYTAKASRKERNAGLQGLAPRKRDEGRKEGNPGGDNPRNRGVHEVENHHPTVKPVSLMQWLVKLVCPPKGHVLDPFGGSGSTGVACRNLGFEFTLIDREGEYAEISERRTEDLFTPVEVEAC